VNVAVELDGFDFDEAGIHIIRFMCDDDVAELELIVRPEG
jgi:hypothetical protein